MKFSVKLTVVTDKSGLDLDAEYDRLGWPEDGRDETFGIRRTEIQVSKDFAKKHRDLFRSSDPYSSSNVAEICLPIEKTDPGDWSDYGSMGMALNYESFDENWIESHIG